MTASDGTAATSPWWDHTRNTIAARILVDVGEEFGVPAAVSLMGSGLHRSDLDDPTIEIEAGQELAIARNLLDRTGGVVGLGVHAGSRYTLGSLGIWGFTLLASPTMRDLVKIGTRYAALSFAFIRPSYSEDAREARVTYDASDIPEDVRSFFVERELAKILTIEPVIVGSRPGFHVETVFDDDRVAALQRVAPHVEVRGGQPAHVLVFSRRLLDSSMPQGNSVTASALVLQCADLLERRSRRRGWAAHVRSKILSRVQDPPGMDEIAQQLHMDERTLRRRLAAEGVSYRDLVGEVRSTIGAELLIDGSLRIEEIAVRLGYHDAAAFSRAFKRWTGKRPGRYRSVDR